ncbi:ATP-dependent RecD-like DNA helicase [bacterium]|nr:ATP-dependent RecD-like DNA helicase [bacterium]
MDLPDLDQFHGAITSIVYQDAERGFVIAEFTPEEGKPLTIVGVIPGAVVGENLRVRGRWEKHAKYGQQLRVESYELVRPSTARGIIAYLSGGLVKGIGPKLASALVQHFGEGVLDILDHHPERLREAPGIGPKKAEALAASWQEHKDVHRIMLFLQEHGAGPTLASRIYERYRSNAMHVMEAEPYRLAREVRGIGFHTADRMARAAGIHQDDPQRLMAGVLHALTEAAGEGHFYLPRDLVLAGARQVLHVDDQLIDLALEQCVQAEYVVQERGLSSPQPDSRGLESLRSDAYFLPEALQIEKELAGLLLRLVTMEAASCADAQPAQRKATCRNTPTCEQLQAWLQRREAMGALPLTDTQAAAVCTALQHPVTIITGGPGTGKTTITRALADAGVGLKWRVALCSPTGRAAKRLSQLSGQPASTIHRLLSWDPGAGRFRFNGAEPLPVDLLIVDEASMVDAPLARDLMRAVPSGAQVVFIGDADQLPSVGPGNFLHDLIDSERFPVVRLTEIFRQAEGGEIVAHAHLIRQGEMPDFVRGANWHGEDCVLMERETAEQAAQAVLRVVTRSLPGLQYGLDDMQVITPMHRGPAGVAALNEALQQALNPPRPGLAEARRGDTVFREGDRVLQTANDYDRNVFNGDIGRIEHIDVANKTLTVRFDQAPVAYEFSALDELELAYALTIHKAQGSEYPAVVMVIHSTHYIMLRRNLFYTALTRAEKLAVIVGDRKGVWKAIKTAGENERLTRLAERLRGELPHEAIAERLHFDEAEDEA